MSTQELTIKAQELKELKLMQEELETEIQALQDAIKAAMGEQEVIIAGPYKIIWKAVTSARVDTTALKKELPDIAQRFTKASTLRRFTIA